MPQQTLNQIVNTGQTVSANHFNGNAIYVRNTDNGVPDESFMEAVNELDMQILRYPAGQPDVAYADGLLIDGGLPDHLIAFMNEARASGLQVVIVTPTLGAYDNPAELQDFADQLLQEFGDVVHAFEIGNEYWNHQTETEYGQIANESLIAIDEALSANDINLDIWIQMGDTGGHMSEFHVHTHDGTWGQRTALANEAILAQLSLDARNIIDGVVEHYYFRIAEQFFGDLSDADQMIGYDYSIWQSALQQDLTLNITEWNIRTTNYYQLGMRAASTLVAQFEFLLSLEVDELYVWPPQHNTSTDLAGGNDVLIDPISGIVVNTVGGAVFDLMSSSLVGMESIESATETYSQEIQHHVFANDSQVVVYVTSRSNSTENVSFSLGNFWLGAELTSAIQVGYDQSSSDGQHYHFGQNEWVQAESVLVDGQAYYLNEHDVNAEITVHDEEELVEGENIVFELAPYEIVELVFDLPSEPVIVGDNEGNSLLGGGAAEYIFGLEGNDVITAGGGSDTLFGGTGNDFLNSGSGHDSTDGGTGNDTLAGWGGADSLFGGLGNDSIEGWFGNDELSGGAGDDVLDGGAGNDLIIGGFGNDLMAAGLGNDTLSYGAGNDVLYGGDGDDTFILGGSQMFGVGYAAENITSSFQHGTNQVVSVEGLIRFGSIVFGGNGEDQILLSAAGDAYFLEDLLSGLHPSIEGDLSSPSSPIRSLGVESISAGAGNDLLDMTTTIHSMSGESMDLFGGAGNDTIWGSDADDLIEGGHGNDIIFAGAGTNTIIGGHGADTFQFTQSSLDTAIVDFDPLNGDHIEIFESLEFQYVGSQFSTNTNQLALEFFNSSDNTISTIFVALDPHEVVELAENPLLLDSCIEVFDILS